MKTEEFALTVPASCSPPKLRREWRGKQVRTKRELRNGVLIIKAGTICIVRYTHRLADLTSTPCDCCGVAINIRRVPWEDLEYLGEVNDKDSQAAAGDNQNNKSI